MKFLQKLKDRTHIKIKGSQVFLLGSLFGASSFFFNAENGQFNSYIEQIIPLKFGGTAEFWMVPLMTTFSALMGLVFTIIWGAYSDSKEPSRFGKRRPFLLGGIVAGISMILYLLSRNYWICFILDVVVIGILANSFVAARASLVPEMTEPEERGRVNSRISIISSIFTFASIGMFLIINEFFKNYQDPVLEQGAYLNYQGHFIILMVTGLVIIAISIIGFVFIKEDPSSLNLKEGKWYQNIKNSFQISELRKHKDFLKILLASTVFMTGTKLFWPWLFPFITYLDLPGSITAVALIIFVFIGFLANYLVGKLADRYGRKKPLLITIFIGSIGFFFVPIATNIILSRGKNLLPGDVLFIFTLIFALTLIMNVVPVQDAWAQDLLNREKTGQFVGILNTISTVSQMIGPWIGGFVKFNLGIEWTFFFSPIFFLLSIPFYMVVKDKMKERLEKLAEKE